MLLLFLHAAGGGAPVSAQAPAAARIGVQRVSLVSRFFSAGQQGAQLEVQVRNTGASAAERLAARLDFGARAQDFTAAALASNASTLAASASTVLTFAIDCAVGARLGFAAVAATVSATDAASGQPAAVTQAPVLMTRVRLPPEFRLVDVRGTRQRVSQGQTAGASVTVRMGSRDVWEPAPPALGPPARDEAAVTFDSARDRVVLFGGRTSSGVLDDTWEWDGSAWRQVATAVSPAARSGHAMAYDETAKRVLLFGGSTGSALLGDTWEFDGTLWSREVGSTAPPARTRHAMASAPGGGGVALFGGAVASGLARDTWLHAASKWASVASANPTTETTPPVPRSGHGMVLEPRFDSVLLFGGETATGTVADTWTFDGTVWQQLEEVSDFGNRSGFSLAGDPISRRVLLFGGKDARGAFPDDLWGWTGNSWALRSTRVEAGATRPAPPPGRTGAALAFDALSSRALLFGGRDAFGSPIGDSWVRRSQPAGVAVTASVVFVGDAGAYSLAPDPNNPSRLSQGETSGFDFAVRVGAQALLGPRTFAVTASARDADTGVAATVVGSGSGSWIVESAGALEVTAIRLTPRVVAPGRAGIAMQADLANTGPQPFRAAVVGLTARPRFNGGATSFPFVASPDNPVQVSAGTTETVAFTFDVDSNTPLGPVAVGLTATGADANRLSPAAIRDATEATLIVAIPPKLTAGPVTLTPSRVVEGRRGVLASVALSNSGPASPLGVLEGLAGGLTFSPGGGSFVVLASPANITALAIGQSGVLTFAVDVLGGAPAGDITVTAEVTGRDAANGGPIELTGAPTARLTVFTPARLEVARIAIQPLLSTGQPSVPVEVTVRHPGLPGRGAPLENLRVGLSFNESLSNFFVTTAAANATTLAAGASAILTFAVDVDPGAPLGNVRVSALASAVDSVSLAAAAVQAEVFADTQVKAPAKLALTGITLVPASAGQGQFGVRAQVAVKNSGPRDSGAAASDIAGRLAFEPELTGFAVKAAPRNATRLAAGASALLTFTVDVGSAVPLGAYAVTALLTARDAGSGVGAAISPTAAVPLQVTAPASIAVGVAPLAAAVSRGQIFSIAAAVTNNGPSAAKLSTAALVFDLPGLRAGAAAGLGGDLPPAGNVTITFPVTVAGDATGGTARATITVGTEAVPGIAGSGVVDVEVSAPPPPPEPTPPVALIQLETPPSSGPRLLILNSDDSFDPDGNGLVLRSWLVQQAPAGAALATTTAASFSYDAFLPGLYRIQLEVRNAKGLSSTASTELEVTDAAPIADAGAPRSFLLPRPVGVTPGATLSVTLDGTESSDPNRTPITYRWRVLAAPDRDAATADSTALAQFDSRTRARPRVTFATGTVDGDELSALSAAGEYRFGLEVSDGTSTATDSVKVVALQPPRPPRVRIAARVADAGPPRLLELDSGGTADPDGDAIAAYAWRLDRAPAGAAPLTAATTRIVYDAFLAGGYLFSLEARDSTGLTGRATAELSVTDVAPLANAGPDRAVVLPRSGAARSPGATESVILDGSGSRDANRTALSYRWTVAAAPDRTEAAADSTALAQFSSRFVVNPTVTFASGTVDGNELSQLKAAGSYRFRLEVSDGTATSTATVKVDVVDPLDPQPAADAGLDRAVVATFLANGSLARTIPDPLFPGQLADFVRLDGRESSDPRGRPIRYAWRVVETPPGSALVLLTDAATAFPTFRPDKPGRYLFELTVTNGRPGDGTDRVAIAVQAVGGNRPPEASAVAKDEARGLETGLSLAALEVETGTTVALDGRASTDPDLADRGKLAYLWSLTSGPSVSLAPTDQSSRVTFVAREPGALLFTLRVTDPGGVADEATVQVRVRAKGAASGAKLALAATAPGSPDGEGVAESGFVFGPSRSLRVTAPTTVTLTGRLDPGQPPAGQTFDFAWRQISGPTVALESTGALGTASLVSVTRFAPTTSRLHEFELTATPIDGGARKPFLAVTRRIRVVVDTARSRVPEAVLPAHRVTVAVAPGESAGGRRVTLDASASLTTGPLLPGTLFSVLWRQVSGPPGTIANPLGVTTTFELPDLGAETAAREYVLELTVDATPPGDRSEPVYLLVTSQIVSATPLPAATAVAAAGGGGRGGGGGCALGAGAASGTPFAPLLLPLALVLLRRDRRAAGGARAPVPGNAGTSETEEMC